MSNSVYPAASGYPAFARFIHWTVFLILIGSFVTGFVGYGGAVTQPWQKENTQPFPPAGGTPGSGAAPAVVAPGQVKGSHSLEEMRRKGKSPWSFNQLHKSIGVVVLALTLLRLIYRAASKYPPAPADLPGVMLFAARANQMLLYAGLLAQPLIGLFGSGKGFKLFGVVTIPSFAIPAYIRPLHTAHVYVAYLLLILIFIHASAALFHHYVRKDHVLRSMLVGP